MKAPTREQLNTALEAAERMRLRDLDPHFLAHCLLYFQERDQAFENLLLHTDRYLRFGMNEQELGAMRRVVEQLRTQSLDNRDATRDTLPV